MSKPPTAPTGRAWAYLGALLGGAMSIAANVAHSFVADSDPSALAIVFAVFWPVALFVGIEVLARVSWPEGRRYAWLRFAGVGPVALVSAIVSYRHLSGLLAYYGEDPVTVTLGPLGIDGLLAVCSAALILTADRRPRLATVPAVVVKAEAEPVATLAPALAASMRSTTNAEAPATPAEATADATDDPTPTEDTPEAIEAAEDAPKTTVEIPPAPPTGRPATQTRQLAEVLKAEDPTRTQQQIAELLGMSRWALRDALKATAPAPAPTAPPRLALVPSNTRA